MALGKMPSAIFLTLILALICKFILIFIQKQIQILYNIGICISSKT